jgi:hypothetical protein
MVTEEGKQVSFSKYEPVWCIMPGRNVDLEETVHKYIKLDVCIRIYFEKGCITPWYTSVKLVLGT